MKRSIFRVLVIVAAIFVLEGQTDVESRQTTSCDYWFSGPTCFASCSGPEESYSLGSRCRRNTALCD